MRPELSGSLVLQGETMTSSTSLHLENARIAQQIDVLAQ